MMGFVKILRRGGKKKRSKRKKGKKAAKTLLEPSSDEELSTKDILAPAEGQGLSNGNNDDAFMTDPFSNTMQSSNNNQNDTSPSSSSHNEDQELPPMQEENFMAIKAAQATTTDLQANAPAGRGATTTTATTPAGNDPNNNSSSSSGTDLTRDLVKKFIADIWNRGEVELIPQVCHPSLRFNGNAGFDRVGHDGLSRMVATIRDSLDDYHCEIHSMVVENNKAFCRLRFTGKHVGNLLGYDPTGSTVAWMGATEFTCQQGKILKVWELGDVKSLEEQLVANQLPHEGSGSDGELAEV